MSSLKDSADRVPTVQLNADLRHAQLELLSAQCATDRLRQRYSVADIVEHGHPELMEKSINIAAALREYYSELDRAQTRRKTASKRESTEFDEGLIFEAIQRVSEYLREQRENYFPFGKPLTPQQKTSVEKYFTLRTLESVRIVELGGRRLPNPSFYAEAKARGIANLPEITHMSSLTFIDVVVFNERVAERALFHGLVHAVQFEMLGLEKYTEAFVSGFGRRNSHFNVPLEMHAHALESKFASRDEKFLVEEEVQQWLNQGRYLPANLR